MKSLTPEQQAFAEEHHGLLLDFMAKHSLGDDYYDLLANRYLKVVVRYLSEEALRKYSFSTVVWYHLRSELSNYARDQVGKLQEIPIEFYCEIPAPEIAPIDDGLWRVVEDNLTYKQFEAIQFRNQGYTNREIAELCGVGRKAMRLPFHPALGIIVVCQRYPCMRRCSFMEERGNGNDCYLFSQQ